MRLLNIRSWSQALKCGGLLFTEMKNLPQYQISYDASNTKTVSKRTYLQQIQEAILKYRICKQSRNPLNFQGRKR